MDSHTTLIRLVASGFVALALPFGAGCGGGSSEIPSDAAVTVSGAEVALSTYCANELDQGASVDEYDASRQAVDDLIATYRAHPDDTYDGRTMKQVLSDRANRLDACDRDAARQLDRALSAGT
jgi:hypothetical protein